MDQNLEMTDLTVRGCFPSKGSWVTSLTLTTISEKVDHSRETLETLQKELEHDGDKIYSWLESHLPTGTWNHFRGLIMKDIERNSE